MKRTLHLFGFLLFASVLNAAVPAGDGHEPSGTANLSVQCSRGSALVQIHVANDRKIGNVVLEVKDQQGRVLYREEGKAMTDELVRRLDKGVFPRGTHQLTVVAKDFAITQPFTIE